MGAAMKLMRDTVVAGHDLVWDGYLGISSAGRDCQPTSYRVMHRMFERVPLAEDDQFIDIGCGRGRVLCFVARQPVARAAGVEIGAEHAGFARRNLENLRGRKAKAWSVTAGSAADFDMGGGTVFYMYNPFGGALFTEVIGKIRQAASAGSKPIRLMYINPVNRAELDSSGWLLPPEVLHTDRHGKIAALLYRSR